MARVPSRRALAVRPPRQEFEVHAVRLQILPDVADVALHHFGIGLVPECQMPAEFGSYRRSEAFGCAGDSLGGG